MTDVDFAAYEAATEGEGLQFGAELLKPDGIWLAEPARATIEARLKTTLSPVQMGALSYAWYTIKTALFMFADSKSTKALPPEHADFISAELSAMSEAIDQRLGDLGLDILGFDIQMRILALKNWAEQRRTPKTSRISQRVEVFARRLEAIEVKPGKVVLRIEPETAIRVAVIIAESVGHQVTFSAVKKYRDRTT